MSPELERLVGRIVLDPAFRKELLTDPDGAITRGGFSLTPDELQQVRDAVKARDGQGDAIDELIGKTASGSTWGG
jgi:hypothetical protein